MVFIKLLLGITFKFVIQNLSSFLTFFSALIAIKYVLYRIQKKKPLPPGPWGVPVFGFLPFLGTSFHETLFGLFKKYGPVCRFRLGSKMIVVLSNQELIREAFARDELTGRPSTNTYDMFEGYGVMNTAGDRWKKQRKFLHSKLRVMGVKAFGPGRELMEAKIKSEGNYLIQGLMATEGKPIYVGSYLNSAAANIVCRIIMSVRFGHNNPTLKRMLELNHEGFKLFLQADITSYIPIMKYSATIKSCFEQLKQNRQETMGMLNHYLQEKRKTFDPDSIKDLIDAYLYEEHADKLSGKETEYGGNNYDQQLLQTMIDLFSAGEETVKACLNWSLLFLLHNENVLSNVQNELDTVIGRSRMPSLSDRPSLPYTEATINEVLRRASIVPLGTAHACTDDTTVGGYLIPKGATVFSSIYSCHMDPKNWVDPEKFEPTRFLDSDNKCRKPKEFMPFGVGKRMCLGEVMARSEIFLILTFIIHVFRIEKGDEVLTGLEGVGGVTNAPKPYKIRFLQREFNSDFIREECV